MRRQRSLFSLALVAAIVDPLPLLAAASEPSHQCASWSADDSVLAAPLELHPTHERGRPQQSTTCVDLPPGLTQGPHRWVTAQSTFTLEFPDDAADIDDAAHIEADSIIELRVNDSAIIQMTLDESSEGTPIVYGATTNGVEAPQISRSDRPRQYTFTALNYLTLVSLASGPIEVALVFEDYGRHVEYLRADGITIAETSRPPYPVVFGAAMPESASFDEGSSEEIPFVVSTQSTNLAADDILVSAVGDGVTAAVTSLDQSTDGHSHDYAIDVHFDRSATATLSLTVEIPRLNYKETKTMNLHIVAHTRSLRNLFLAAGLIVGATLLLAGLLLPRDRETIKSSSRQLGLR